MCGWGLMWLFGLWLLMGRLCRRLFGRLLLGRIFGGLLLSGWMMMGSRMGWLGFIIFRECLRFGLLFWSLR